MTEERVINFVKGDSVILVTMSNLLESLTFSVIHDLLKVKRSWESLNSKRG